MNNHLFQLICRFKLASRLTLPEKAAKGERKCEVRRRRKRKRQIGGNSRGESICGL